MNVVSGELSKKKKSKIQLVGFGTFGNKRESSKRRKNPQTGEK